MIRITHVSAKPENIRRAAVSYELLKITLLSSTNNNKRSKDQFETVKSKFRFETRKHSSLFDNESANQVGAAVVGLGQEKFASYQGIVVTTKCYKKP